MAIKYKIIKKVQPGVAGGGQRKYYASANVMGEKTLEKLTTSIERCCTVNGADIRAVLYSLVEVIVDDLADSNAVRLGELGSLHVSISSEGKEKEEEIDATCIKKARVIFSPGKALKDMLEKVSYEKL